MPINPYYNFRLIGANGKTTNLRFQGVEISDADLPTELNLAATALEAIRTELNDVTDANVDAYSFEVSGTGAVGGLPASADIHEEAALQMDITPAGEATKLATQRIPAPSAGIFQGTSGPSLDIVDVTDADLVAYVNALATHVLISDGEAINGVLSGVRRTKRIRS